MKAFDQCPKNCILHVLLQRGAPDWLLRLLQSYLSDRQQLVSINGIASECAPVLSGVAQGSILGPYLFNAYIDSIFSMQMSAHSFLLGYADDVLLVKLLLTPESEHELAADLNRLISVYESKKLNINPTKSKLMILSPHIAKLTNPISIYGQEILQCDSFKYLGYLLDSKLSFDQHFQKLSLQVKREIGTVFWSLGKWVPRNIFWKVYNSAILPQLSWSFPITCPRNKYTWALIEKKTHRYACRLTTNNYQSSYPELLAHLNSPSLAQLF